VSVDEVRYSEILYTVDGAAAIVTLNRPDRLNAWTAVMSQEVRHALARAEADDQVVAIIVTGAGRAFCAGADLNLLSGLASGSAGGSATAIPDAAPGDADVDPGYRQVYSYLASLRKPVIAAVNGACVGMAMPIACFCDLRFAGPDASFHTAFARRGLIAEWGLSWILPRIVGPGHALDLLFSARKVSADEAERMGLVNAVVRTDLLEHCKQYVTMLAQHCAPHSMHVIKRQLYADLLCDANTALERSTSLMLQSFKGDDLKEGVASFLEKRPPRFRRLGSGEP
jgi:enoyl-CoA hydratase/carnithine racemase